MTSAPPLSPGTRVQDWTVVRLLGVGGFGFVYEVEREGERLALKMAAQPPGPADAAQLDARARNEYACLQQLTHPHVVRVHEHGRWPEGPQGRHFFLMELVEGVRLSDWCLRARPPLRAVVEVGMKLALALEAMHGVGVLHRDLKQDNVLVRPDGEPVLIDFGIATGPGASLLTTHILPPGTTHYRSPESITFFRRRHFEPGGSYRFKPTDDLYALGVLLYETLTGRPPFPPHLPEAQLLGAIEFLAPPAPASLNPQVPEALSAVVLRLLEKRPEQRYPDGRRLHEALAAVRDALGEAGEEPFIMESEDTARAPTEPLLVSGAEPRPPRAAGDWVNLDELLALVTALSQEPSQGAGPEPRPDAPGAAPGSEAAPEVRRAWLLPVFGVCVALLAVWAGWLLNAPPRPVDERPAESAPPVTSGGGAAPPAPAQKVGTRFSKQTKPLSALLPPGE